MKTKTFLITTTLVTLTNIKFNSTINRINSNTTIMNPIMDASPSKTRENFSDRQPRLQEHTYERPMGHFFGRKVSCQLFWIFWMSVVTSQFFSNLISVFKVLRLYIAIYRSMYSYITICCCKIAFYFCC